MRAPQLYLHRPGRHQVLQRLLQEGAGDRAPLQLQASRLRLASRRRTAPLIALAVAAGVLAMPAAQSSSGLQRLLDAEMARVPARAGVWVKHLTTGEEASVRADETFNSASVIKLAVLVLAYQMAEKGTLSLDQRITITAADVRGGSGIFR